MKKVVGIGVLLGCVVVAGLTWLKQRESNEVSVEEPPRSQPQASKNMVRSDLAKGAGLPESAMPLANSVAQLKELAMGGNEYAACRLAAEYTRCRNVQKQAESLESFISQAQSASESAAGANAERSVAFISAAMKDDEIHCANVTLPSEREVIALWRAAAIRGHVPSMAYYSSGSAFGPFNTLEVVDDLKLYASEAERLAEGSARAGNLVALLALARAYSPEGQAGARSLLAQAVGLDRAKALGYYEAYRDTSIISMESNDSKIIDAKISALRATMSGAEIEASVPVRRSVGSEEGGDVARYSVRPAEFARKGLPAMRAEFCSPRVS